VFIARQTPKSLEATLEQGLAFVGWERLVPRQAVVFLKPNLTYPEPKAGVTTTPAFIEGVVRVLKTRTDHIYVGESDGGYRSWPGEMALASHAIPELCKRYGIRAVNLSRLPTRDVALPLGRNREVKVGLPTLLLDEIECFITLPVPKIHFVTIVSGASKNQWGCIPDSMRIRMHPVFTEGIYALNAVLRPKLVLADATYMLDRSGPMFGEPVAADLLLVSDDVVAHDLAMCDLMGIPVRRVRYLQHACRISGVNSLADVELNVSPANLRPKTFYLKRTLRNHVVVMAFGRSWAIKLLWDSWLGRLIHKVTYSVWGDRVAEDVARLSSTTSASRLGQ
jgi:uncharacterized protein (DUF362 family)